MKTKTKLVVGAGFVAVMCAALDRLGPGPLGLWTGAPGLGTGGEAVSAASPSSPSLSSPSLSRACSFEAGWKASFEYDARLNATITMAGQPVSGEQVAKGFLALEALETNAAGETVLLGQFSKMNKETLAAHGEAFHAPFLMKLGSHCELRGFARESKVAKRTAQAQQISLHELWLYAPEQDGTEPVTFENGNGLVRGRMTRQGAALHRTLTGYELAWHAKAAPHINDSMARITLGSGWIERFEGREVYSSGMMDSAIFTLLVTREPGAGTAVAPSASRKQSNYTWENLLPGDFTELNAGAGVVPPGERRYLEVMKHQTLEGAFEVMSARVAERSNVEEQWHEMAGFLNGHPEKISEFADGLRAADFPPELKGVGYLVLSRTVHAQAREALMDLRNDFALPRFDRVRANLALVTRKDVGAPLARALRADALTDDAVAETDPFNRNAAMHLGILAHLHRNDGEVQEIAHSTITQVLTRAGDDTAALAPALGAVGNLAELNFLPTIEAYTRHANVDVRVLVPRSVRGYAYAQSEPLLLEWLARETSPEVKQEIFNVVHHQLADAKRNASEAMVQQALKHLAMKPTVFSRQSIISIIGPTKSEYPGVRKALMDQVPEEFRKKSGLVSQISHYLAPEELNVVFASMPEFAHQFGVVQQQQALAALLDADRQVAAKRPQVPEEMPESTQFAVPKEVSP